eukprot:5657486-Amphidinium_carterae.1
MPQQSKERTKRERERTTANELTKTSFAMRDCTVFLNLTTVESERCCSKIGSYYFCIEELYCCLRTTFDHNLHNFYKAAFTRMSFSYRSSYMDVASGLSSFQEHLEIPKKTIAKQ